MAREIAQILHANERIDGYLKSNEYCVTWALGQLVSVGIPEDHGVRGFDKASLPILPDPFLLTVRSIKKRCNRDHSDPSALKQLKSEMF